MRERETNQRDDKKQRIFPNSFYPIDFYFNDVAVGIILKSIFGKSKFKS
jgi:hypothetical protein